MKYFSTVAALITVIPNVMAALTINTPMSVVQCQPQLLSWSDGMGPYYLTIIPGGQPSATPLKTFDTQSGTSITWVVDIPGGTSVTFALKDSTGATAYTDMVTIQKNNDPSCMGGQSGSGNSGNSGNSGSGNSNAGPATQVTDATSSIAVGSTGPAPSGSVSTSRPAAAAASSGTSRPVTTQSPVSATAQRTTSAAAAAGTSSSTPSANTSGAESLFKFGGYLVAGALGLVGAVVL